MSMNRSIAKTRNQLQRITLKINQLKTKYTDNNLIPSLHNNEQSSPTNKHQKPIANYKQKQFSNTMHSRQINAPYPKYSQQIGVGITGNYTQTQSFKSGSMGSSHVNSSSGSGNYGQSNNNYQYAITEGSINEQTYRREFKIFRNQIYNHVQQCLLVQQSKDTQKDREKQRERQQQIIIQKVLSQINGNSGFRNLGGKGRNNTDDRIKKIQEQITNCLSSIQNVMLQVKKNQKYQGDKISAIETMLHKQQSPVKDQSFSSQQLLQRILPLERGIINIQAQLTKQNNKLTKIVEQNNLQEQFNVKLENVQKRIQRKIIELKDKIDDRDQINSKINEIQQKIANSDQQKARLTEQINQINSKINTMRDAIQQNNKINKSKEVEVEQFDEARVCEIVQKLIKQLTQDRTNLIEQQLERNCKDMASIGQEILNIHSRAEQLLTSQQNINTELQSYKLNIDESLKSIITNFDKHQKQLKQVIGGQLQQIDKKQEQVNDVKSKFQQIIDLAIGLQQQQKKYLNQLTKQVKGYQEGIQNRIYGRVVEDGQQHINQAIKQITKQINMQDQKDDTVKEDQISNKTRQQLNAVLLKISDLQSQLQQKILNAQPNIKQLDQQTKPQPQPISHSQIQQQCRSLILQKQHQSDQKLTDKISQLESSLKETIFNEMQKLQSKFIIKQKQKTFKQKTQQRSNTVRIQTIDTMELQESERIKTSPILREDDQGHQQAEKDNNNNNDNNNNESKKNVETVVDQKLNQFQSDINQTIKLLYEDIQNKVNEMLGHTGIMQFRSDFEQVRQRVSSLQHQLTEFVQKAQQQKQHALSLLHRQQDTASQTSTQYHDQQFECKKQGNLNAVSNTTAVNTVSNVTTNNVNSSIGGSNQLQKLKQQIYEQFNDQINKLSNLMERALQQIQIKVQKLDSNFSYVYERMSNIEYDNANFKDKLTSLLAERTSMTPSTSRVIKHDSSHKKQEEEHSSVSVRDSSNILDVLGQLGTGKHFFDN